MCVVVDDGFAVVCGLWFRVCVCVGLCFVYVDVFVLL